MVAATEKGFGGRFPGGGNAADSESDDEWPDVSDHEDEDEAIPSMESHTRGTEAGEVRSSDARGVSGAEEPASTTIVAVVSTPVQEPSNQGFHRLASASAFGGTPDEFPSETFVSTSKTANASGFVTTKTGGLGDLFGGDTANAEADVIPTVVSAVTSGASSPTTAAMAPSPFSAMDGADDDFFNELASPAKAKPAPFGAPPPPNDPAPVSEPVAVTAVEQVAQAHVAPVVQHTQPAQQTQHAQSVQLAQPQAYQQTPQPQAYQQAYQQPYQQQQYTAQQQPYQTQQYQQQQSYQQQQYQQPYHTQDYAAEAQAAARHQPQTLLPPTVAHSPVSAPTFMVPTPVVPATEVEEGDENQPVHKPSQPTAYLPYVPPPPVDSAPTYDASPIQSAYDADSVSRPVGADSGSIGGNGYGVYRASSSEPVYFPDPAQPEPVYDHVVPSVGSMAAYGRGNVSSGPQSFGAAPSMSFVPPVGSVDVTEMQQQITQPPVIPSSQFMIPEAVGQVQSSHTGTSNSSYAGAETFASSGPQAPTLPPPPAAPAAGYDFSPLPTQPATQQESAAYDNIAGHNGAVYDNSAASVQTNEASYDTSQSNGGAYGSSESYASTYDPYSTMNAMNQVGSNVPSVPTPEVLPQVAPAYGTAQYTQWAPDVASGASGDQNSQNANVNGAPITQITQAHITSAYSAAGSNHAAGDAGTPRSPHGRPPCAVASFGFGGRLAISSPGYPVLGGVSSSPNAAAPGSVCLHNLADSFRAGVGGESMANEFNAGAIAPGAAYLDALSAQTYPPLINRNPSLQSLVQFAEERAAGVSGTSAADDDGEALLWGVLKAMCASGAVLSGTGGGDPVGGLNGSGLELDMLLLGNSEGGVSLSSDRPSPSGTGVDPNDANAQAALLETQRLLFSGRWSDALEVAMRAGLWPHAMLLASKMGDAHQLSVSQRMAKTLCAPGSPLRTLELSLAGAGDELLRTNGGDHDDATSLLPRWKEHLAILASNRGLSHEKSDDVTRVMTAIGDSLWMRSGAVQAAHVCYALAGTVPAPFHPNARVCLLGANHKRNPRTYHADVLAIQRTEYFEMALMGSGSTNTAGSSVLNNPLGALKKSPATSYQYLPSFQPYKVLYAGYLAELGFSKQALQVNDTVLKLLKNREFIERHSRDGSVKINQLSQIAHEMEHRLKGHLGGKGGLGFKDLGSAATSIFGGFSKMFDKGVNKMFGDEGVTNGVTSGINSLHQRTLSSSSVVSNTNATVDPSSVAPTSRATSNVPSANHSRSVSNASNDFSGIANAYGTPSDSNHEGANNDQNPNGASPIPAKGGFFRQFSGVLGKVGAAIPLPKAKNQAKLGDENTMFYDEKLGRWVEPGKEGEVDTGPLAPPPTGFGMGGVGSGFNVHKSGSNNSAGGVPGVPNGGTPGTVGGTPETPNVPSQGSFSMRAAKGRSKYVDAFSLSGPAAAEHAAAAAASAANTSASTTANVSLFPAGLMPPGLMAPGAPGAAPPAMLMIPSPIAGGFDPNDESNAPLPLSPVARSETPEPVSDTSNSTEDASKESQLEQFQDKNETDSLAADEDDQNSTEPSIPPPPIAPMKDLRLTEAPESDSSGASPRARGVGHGIRQETNILSPSYGDGKVLNAVAPKNEARNFFVPGPSVETSGVVGGGATCDDVDDPVEGDSVWADGSYVASEGAVVEATEHDPFGDGVETDAYQSAHNAQLDANQPGFFDRDGQWRLGQWPGGEYDQNGRWNEGYWTQERFWVAGFWDEVGAWVEGTRPGGYFNRNGGWVPETNAEVNDNNANDDASPTNVPPSTATTKASEVIDALGGVGCMGSPGDERGGESDGEMTEMAL